MKKITLLILFFGNFIFAQNFTDHLIDSTTGDALSTKITDLDNDGDLDIIAAYYNEPGTTNTGKLVWYENDGSQSFTNHVIDNAINGAIYVAVVDANNDGNKDLLLNAYDGNALYLYANLGGTPISFSPKLTLDAAAIGSNYSADADFDGDNILDAVSANYGGGELAWYKWDGNISIVKNVIDAAIPAVSSVETGDLNADGNMDLVVAAGNALYWYSNNGAGNFTKNNIPASNGFNGAITAYFVDFDGDSDLDIIGSASALDEVAWFENDGNQVFTKHIVGSGVDYASYGMATDFNNDGNMDVVVSATNTNELLWFENDGTNLVFTQHVAATAATVGDSYAIDLNDIDGDGDIDVSLTAPGPNKLFWLENDYVNVVNIDDLFLFNIQYYPNPVKDTLTIQANEEIQNVKIYNMLGQLVTNQNATSTETTLDTKTLSVGAYFVKTQIKNQVFTFKIIK